MQQMLLNVSLIFLLLRYWTQAASRSSNIKRFNAHAVAQVILTCTVAWEELKGGLDTKRKGIEKM